MVRSLHCPAHCQKYKKKVCRFYKADFLFTVLALDAVLTKQSGVPRMTPEEHHTEMSYFV